MNLLDPNQQKRLIFDGTVMYFIMFSFNALATSTIASLVGAKWSVLTGQERFLIIVSILANWTGLITVFLQKTMSRIASGKSPVSTGDTETISKNP